MKMSEDNSQAILSAACLQLGMLGARITQTFSTRIERIGLTHKQVGLLAVVDGELAHSQREIAARLQVAPSLVVSLVDQLIELGAVKRERSTSDRRVQNIVLPISDATCWTQAQTSRRNSTANFVPTSRIPDKQHSTRYWPNSKQEAPLCCRAHREHWRRESVKVAAAPTNHSRGPHPHSSSKETGGRTRRTRRDVTPDKPDTTITE